MVIVKKKYDGMMIFTNVHIYIFDPCFAVKGKPSCFKLCFGCEKLSKGVDFFSLVLKRF